MLPCASSLCSTRRSSSLLLLLFLPLGPFDHYIGTFLTLVGILLHVASLPPWLASLVLTYTSQMGAHRFTLLEKNLVVAATDMPDYDDRETLGDKEHYSKTHAKIGIYGLEKLYTNNHRANEDIRIYIDGTYALHRKL